MSTSTNPLLAVALSVSVVWTGHAAAPVALTLKGEWPGYARGYSTAFAVKGQHAYIASTVGLQVIDISDPTDPRRIGGYESSGSVGSGIALSGDYAYLAAAGLQVYDISKPTDPQLVGGYDLGGAAYGRVAVSGDHAYVVDWEAGLHVIDVSDSVNPQRIGGYESSGGVTDVAVSGHHAYVVGSEEGLEVLDISTPANPGRVGGADINGRAYRVAVSGDYAYVGLDHAMDGNKLLVFHIFDPANPELVGGVGFTGEQPLNVTDVTVSGDYAYVASGFQGSGSLEVIDVSNPANPLLIGRYDTTGTIWIDGVAVSGDFAYVMDETCGWSCGWGEGLLVLDISDPTQPNRVGGYQLSGSAQGVTLSGNHAYLADGQAGLQVIDISNPAELQRIGGYDTSGSAHDVAVSGDYAFVADAAEGGLKVIDISDPGDPELVGEYETAGYNWTDGVAVSGGFAYLADGVAGFQVIDISNPADPQRVGGHDTSGWAEGVAVLGDYAYVALEGVWDPESETPIGGGLQVIDISNPAEPQQVGGYDTSGTTQGVVVSGNHAYLADGDAGFHVIDVSNPADPRWVAAYNTAGSALDVAISGDYAYVACRSFDEEGIPMAGGLEVVDISDPTNPQRIGGFDTPGAANDVAVSGNLIYVADERRGLLVLQQFRPPRFDVAGQDPFTFSVSGEAGMDVTIQRSSNLQDWEDWRSVTLGDAPFELSDPDADGAVAVFYRAIE